MHVRIQCGLYDILDSQALSVFVGDFVTCSVWCENSTLYYCILTDIVVSISIKHFTSNKLHEINELLCYSYS